MFFGRNRGIQSTTTSRPDAVTMLHEFLLNVPGTRPETGLAETHAGLV